MKAYVFTCITIQKEKKRYNRGRTGKGYKKLFRVNSPKS